MRPVLLLLGVALLGAAAVSADSLCQQVTGKSASADQNAALHAVIHDAANGPTAAGSSCVITSVTFSGFFVDAETQDYFNGVNTAGHQRSLYSTGSVVKNSSSVIPDYSGDSTNAEALFEHLGSYFGGLLGCTQQNQVSGDFPSYSSLDPPGKTDLYQVHQNMSISNATWNAFVASVAGSLQCHNVSSSAISSFASQLKQFLRQSPTNEKEICNGDDCPCAPGFSGSGCTGNAAPAVSFSFVTIALAALLALMLRQS